MRSVDDRKSVVLPITVCVTCNLRVRRDEKTGELVTCGPEANPWCTSTRRHTTIVDVELPDDDRSPS